MTTPSPFKNMRFCSLRTAVSLCILYCFTAPTLRASSDHHGRVLAAQGNDLDGPVEILWRYPGTFTFDEEWPSNEDDEGIEPQDVQIEVDTYFSEASRSSWVEELPPGVEFKSPLTGVSNITDAFSFLLTLRGFRLINGEPSLSENAKNAFYDFLDDLDNIAGNYSGVLDPVTLRLLGGGDFEDGNLEEYQEYLQGKDGLLDAIYEALSYAGSDALSSPVSWLKAFAAEIQKNGGSRAFDGRGAENVRIGQNAIVQSQLQLSFNLLEDNTTAPPTGAVAGRKLLQKLEASSSRRRLLQTTNSSSDSTGKPFSDAAEALARAALQNGGTAAFSIDSLQDVLVGQNKLLQQGYERAQLVSPNLTPEQRATVEKWAANLRATARSQGGAAGAQTDSFSQDQVLTGVSTLLANLTRYQNNVIRSAAATLGNTTDPAAKAQAQAVMQWARENGGTAITTLQDITSVIEGANRVVRFGEAFYNASLAKGDVSGLTWAAAVIREGRRRGADAAYTVEDICDSVAGLQILRTETFKVDGTSDYLINRMRDLTYNQSPLKPNLTTTLRPGSSSLEVAQLQALLAWFGHYYATPSGKFDNETSLALQRAYDAGTLKTQVTTVSQTEWQVLWARWYSSCTEWLDTYARDVPFGGYRSYVTAMRRQTNPNSPAAQAAQKAPFLIRNVVLFDGVGSTNGNVVFLNNASEALSGCEAEEADLFGSDPRALINPATSPTLLGVPLFFTPENGTLLEEVLQLLEGTGFDTDTIVSAIMDAGNKTGLNPLFLASAARGAGNASSNPLAIKGGACKSGTCYNVLNLVGSLDAKGGPATYEEFCTPVNTPSSKGNAAALKLAEEQGWTSPEQSISGGADLLALVGLQRLYSPDGPPILTPQLAGVAEAIIGLEGLGGVRPRFTISGLRALQAVLVDIAVENPTVTTFVLPVYPDLPATYFGAL